MSVNLKLCTVLVLQDDVTAWLELEAVLSNAGCQDITTFHYREVVELWLEHFMPDLAIVDTNLNGQPSSPVVSMLTDQNVTVVYYSELKPSSCDERDLSGRIIWLRKPSPPHTILETIIASLKTADIGEVRKSVPTRLSPRLPVT